MPSKLTGVFHVSVRVPGAVNLGYHQQRSRAMVDSFPSPGPVKIQQSIEHYISKWYTNYYSRMYDSQFHPKALHSRL